MCVILQFIIDYGFAVMESRNKSHKVFRIDLTELNLSDVQVDEELAKLRDLSVIEEGYFYKNNLSFVPERLRDATKLVALEMHNNQIWNLEPVCDLVNLSNLYLQNNNITFIHPHISRLSNLAFCHLGNNRIKVVPKEIGALTLLDTLVLSNNKIEMLPCQMKGLKRLRSVQLVSNPKLDKDLQVSHVDEFAQTQSLLKTIADRFKPFHCARTSALCLIWIRKKFKNEIGLFGSVPLEIVKEMAKYLYSTKEEDCWK